MRPEEVERQTTTLLQALRRELDQRVTDEQLTEIGRNHYARLSLHATINDFIPLLVYRHTKEELMLLHGKKRRATTQTVAGPARRREQRRPKIRSAEPRRPGRWIRRRTRRFTPA